MANPRITPLLLILPGFVLGMAIILYPLWELLRLASHDVTRFGLTIEFSGWANFARILRDPLFAAALWRTIVWTVIVVSTTLLVSLPIALILNTDFMGRGLARVLIMLPWSISLTMTAVVWRWALNGTYGLFNVILQDLGLISEPEHWLARADTAFPIEIALGILVSMPFTIAVFLGGLSSVPPELHEAAQMDGAGPLSRLRHIILPCLAPFMHIALVLNFIYVFNSFPIIWVMTEGGPANSTDILVTYLYKLAFRFGRMGDAAALSLIMFTVLLASTLLYARSVMRREAQE